MKTGNNMDFAEYQNKAISYRLPSADETYVLFNLTSEVGEFYGKLAKAIRDKTTLEVGELAKEIGDILWHLSALCDDLGIELNDVATMNIEKLESRKIRNVITGSGDNR